MTARQRSRSAWQSPCPCGSWAVTASPVLPALGSSTPVSPYVTTVSFVRYAADGGHRTRRRGARRTVAAPV